MSEQNQAQEAMIPKSRLDQVLEQKRQLQSQLEGLTSRMGEMESTLQAAQALTSRVQELEASLETTRAQASTERTLLQAGLRDEEGLKVAQMLYDAQPQESRPSLEDWMKNPPRAVQAYLEQPQSAQAAAPVEAVAPEQAAAAPQTVPPAAQPAANRGAVPQPASSSPFSADNISRMSPSEYEAQRDSILAALR